MTRMTVFLVWIATWATSSYAQGVIYFDGSNNSSKSPNATSEGEVFMQTSINSPLVLDTTTDINVELLYGPTADTVNSAVVTLLLSDSTSTVNTATGGIQPAAGDITSFGAGVLFDNSGNGYQLQGTSPGQTEYFEVLGWTGDYSSFAAAQDSGSSIIAISGVFSEVLTSSMGEESDIENMPALVFALVPEPTTLMLTGLGGLSLLSLRYRK